MSPEAIEFLIVVVAALLIVGAVIDTFKLLANHREVKRSRFLEETRQQRQDRYR